MRITIEQNHRENAMPTSTLFESTLTDRYQTTIPKVVRETLGLGKGDRLKYSIDAGKVSIVRADVEEANDPILEEFLDFLARDMKEHPKRIQAIDSHFAHRITSLAQDVQADLDQPLEDDR
jgi:antitoxin PrlF